MTHHVFHYRFRADVEMAEVQSSLLLAVWGAESLFGETRVALEGRHSFDAEERTCAVDATTTVGQTLSRLFAGYLRREFAPGQFSVSRIESPAAVVAAVEERL